jgi:hypothetical protein
VVCAELRAGTGSYIDFVVDVKRVGRYELSAMVSAGGATTLSTAAVVDDAKQADVGTPMKKLVTIEKSPADAFKIVSAGPVPFEQTGLHLLRFSSEVKKQLLQIDRIQLRRGND